jgi:hypothetical protein
MESNWLRTGIGGQSQTCDDPRNFAGLEISFQPAVLARHLL